MDITSVHQLVIDAWTSHLYTRPYHNQAKRFAKSELSYFDAHVHLGPREQSPMQGGHMQCELNV